MKKFRSLFVFFLILLLCGCGKEQEPVAETITETTINETQLQPQTVESVGEDSTKQEKDTKNRMDFEEPVLVAEDENMKLELLCFYQEITSSGGNDGEMEKFISFKFYNKSNHGLAIVLPQLFIENEAATCTYISGPPIAPAGKSVVCNVLIQSASQLPLESLDQLSKLEGNMVIAPTETSSLSNYMVPFSFADALNSRAEGGVESAHIEELSVGETAETDMAAFTLLNMEYRKGLYTGTQAQLINGTGELYEPDSGMVFANPEFSLQNLSKGSYDIHKEIRITVDYNNGYQYTMDDHTCYMTHDGGTWIMYASGGGKGQTATLSPLMTDTFSYYIPAIAAIETDMEAPLRIIVSLPSSNGNQEFAYRIR